MPLFNRDAFLALTARLQRSSAALGGLALLLGLGCGLGALVFRWLIKTFTMTFTGHADYAGLGHVANPHLPWLGRWFVLLTPVAAGLVYGPLVHFFAREARGHGVPEVMDAVARRGGRIAPRVAGVKALASALCIGGGGSVGREGPIVQIGAALGSGLGQLTRMPEHRMRVLVACGAAGGIGATFNAPMAGVFFAMEVVLGDFGPSAFGLVVLSSVTASIVGRAAFGDVPFLHLPTLTVQHLAQYPLFAVLGVLAGVTGVVFFRVLYLIEDACDWAWRGPEWLRPAVGGLLVGGILLLLPQMYGVGYPVLESAIAGKYAVGLLLVLLLGKMVATSLTIGAGGSGGVFAPSLFVGAMLGAAYGSVLQHVAPGVAGPVSTYAMIGMGAVFAGAAHAPITAVVILFELTGEYTVILPLMTAIVVAVGISRMITRDTVYTLKLRRRGVDLNISPQTHAMRRAPIHELIDTEMQIADAQASLASTAEQVLRVEATRAAVVDAEGCYVGVLTSLRIAQQLADGEHDEITASSAADWIQPLPSNATVGEALDLLDHGEHPEVPIVDAATGRPVGWLSARSMLLAVSSGRLLSR